MGSKHCNIDGRSVWTARDTMLKNKPHLNTFHEKILVNLWTFQLAFVCDWPSNECGERKVFHNFDDVRHISAASDVFLEVMKVTNHIGLWDTELTWYTLIATQRICLYGLEHDLGIHSFWPTWLCLIVDVLAVREKFLQTSADVYYDQLHLQILLKIFFFVSSRHNDLVWTRNVLELEYAHLCGFQITHRVNQCTTCKRANYFNKSGVLTTAWTILNFKISNWWVVIYLLRDHTSDEYT